jgi:hypothetical protein
MATAKKTSAKKAPAKKTTGDKPKKATAGKRASSRKKKDTEPSAIEADSRADETGSGIQAAEGDVNDAEIIAETPATEVVADVDTDETDGGVEATELSDEERELAAVYGDDMAAPAAAHGEFQDGKTRDEDRPMMPEINAREERKQRWEEPRERRKSRRVARGRQRDERRQQHAQPGGQPQGQEHGGQRPHHGTSGQQEQRPPFRENRPVDVSAPAKINGHESTDWLARVGTPLGDAASAVFTQLRNGQPLPVRQLAAMMRKRNLVNQDPEQLWPQLKAELLGDERSYRTLGLRPRIVYRGRDLFAPGPVSMSQTADAEAGVASALSRLASATHKALSGRLAKASPAGFERLIHAYLVAAGFREIDWVKRVGGISYAQAVAPGIARSVLISARSGSEAIDRRGIGELRVGVEAKDLVAGILFSAGELSEDAERELERAGRSISVVCGDQLVATLINAGVGVVSAAAPVHYLDDQLLDELLAG